MSWIRYVAYFWGGAFFTHALPHFISGVMGRPFQSPFAKPPGEGLSSSMINVLWGYFNFVIAYLLVCRVGEFDLRSADCTAAFGLWSAPHGMPVGAPIQPLPRWTPRAHILSDDDPLDAKNGALARKGFRRRGSKH